MLEIDRKQASCKLYHNPTWFETKIGDISTPTSAKVANYTTIQLGLKHADNAYFPSVLESCKLYHNPTWFETREYQL